jgi:CBS domain-containing protein
VETVEMSDRVAFALHKMDLGGYRHLPILDQGRVTGVLSVRRILNHITAAL